MAVRQDRGRWTIEFQQRGKRIFRRCPPGITKAQAQELETKIRRELFERQDLGHPEDLTLEGAIGLWLQDNRRKNQKQAVSEAKQWEPLLKGRLLKDAPEVAAEAVKQWTALRSVRYATSGSRTPSLTCATTAGGVTESAWSANREQDAARTTYVHGTTGRSTTDRASDRRSTGRTTTPAKASTINRRLMLLKAVCKAMWRRKLIGENLSPRIQTLREPPHKDVYLSRAQVMTLSTSAPSQMSRHAILIVAYSGLRASELLNIRPEDIGPSGTLTVRASTSKTGKSRLVPVPSGARQALRSLPLSISYWQLRKEFISARKKAKLPATVTLHTLRHTCASWLINAGVDLYTVGKILGHSSPQTTQRYAHLATDTLEKAMARLR